MGTPGTPIHGNHHFKSLVDAQTEQKRYRDLSPRIPRFGIDHLAMVLFDGNVG